MGVSDHAARLGRTFISACTFGNVTSYRLGVKMAHKFQVGDFVEFKPTGSKQGGLFKIVMRLPEEFRAMGWQYRIKSDQEGFERTVYEWDLSPSIVPETTYEPMKAFKRAGRRA